MASTTDRDELFRRLAEPFTAERVFDCLADVVYFVKNDRAEYVVVNRTLAERCGVGDKRRILGKTAAELFSAPLGLSYWEQDVRLIRTGEAVVNQLELHLYPTGLAGWCLTDKFPLGSTDGRTIGLVGISQDLHRPDESAHDYDPIAAALAFARERLANRLTAADLAAAAGMGAYQFDQRVRRLFQLTTGQLLLKLRMDAASGMLARSEQSIAAIGFACGYADQSAFARQFRRTTGLTPGQYRATARTRTRSNLAEPEPTG